MKCDAFLAAGVVALTQPDPFTHHLKPEPVCAEQCVHTHTNTHIMERCPLSTRHNMYKT